jgi:hypothetical protein
MRMSPVDRDRQERGVVNVTVAISLVVIMAMAAIAIDLGSARERKRNLVTATDSAALAAVAVYLEGGDGCDTTDDDYVALHDDLAVVTACTPGGDAAGDPGPIGWVTVEADRTIDYRFAPVIGIDSTTVSTRTTARHGPPASATGLRPLGLCMEGDAELEAWLLDPSAASGEIQITYSKDEAAACGGGLLPGNWAIMDFDGGANSVPDINDWIVNGYPFEINIGTLAGDCTTEPEACYEGDPGAFAPASDSALASLVGEEFQLPIFNIGEGAGATTLIHIAGVVNVELVSFLTSGPQDDRYLTLIISPGIISGTCCGSGVDTGVDVIGICAVETTDPADCAS